MTCFLDPPSKQSLDLANFHVSIKTHFKQQNEASYSDQELELEFEQQLWKSYCQ